MELKVFEAAYYRKNNSDSHYGITGESPVDQETLHPVFAGFDSVLTFIGRYGNSGYGEGLYRTHSLKSAIKWTALLEGYYPDFKGKIACFGYDWEGNMFTQRMDHGESVVMIFEIATGDYFELEQTIQGFHEEDLTTYGEETIHIQKFQSVIRHLGVKELAWNKCIGHKISLLLGGEDGPENMEIVDLEVYWEIQQQIMDSLNELP